MRKFILTSLFIALAVVTAQAQGINGNWSRDNGNSKVRFSNCGDGVCGTVTWTKTAQKDEKNPDESKRSRPVAGIQVFSNMKSTGANSWSGSAYNPEDGKTYRGKATLNGDKLTTQGCVLGGMICRSASWTRS